MKTNIKQYLKSQKPTSNTDPKDLILSSTELASHDDVLTEILLRLPIRSLLRSKCVSKHWRSLISDHRFALIRNPNPNPPCGVFLQRIGNVGNPEYEFVPFDRGIGNPNSKPPFKKLKFDGDRSTSGIIVLHSSNGLMLCYSLHEQFYNITKSIEYNASYYVYNPTINQVVTLPNPNFRRRPRGMTLVFNPSKSRHYKVICVGGHYWTDDLYTMEIYSSETGRWKTSGKPFGNQIDTEFTGGVYWNDAVHWINKKGFVFYYNVINDRVDRVSTPGLRDGWNVKQHCYPLVESRDCLLFINVSPPSSLKVDVYEMCRDYSGWSVKYHVDLDLVVTRFPEIDRIALALGYFRLVQPFVIHCFVEGGREEDAFLVLEIPGKAIKYNVGLRSFEELCDLELSKPLRLCVASDGFSKLGRWPGAFLFFESLSKVL